jgi:hypothetical protein
MPIHLLDVPFIEKDAAKSLGARWDAARKSWFVPDGIDTALFEKWLPQITVQSSRYFIAESSRDCWKCQQVSPVFGLVLPTGHEEWTQLDDSDRAFESDDAYQAWLDSDESVGWVIQESPCVLLYVTHLPEIVQLRLQSRTDRYYRDFSKTTQSSYWMNHCRLCGTRQGDFETIEEYDSPFRPAELQSADKISLRQYDESFRAAAPSIAYEPGFFERMIRER